MKSYLNCNKIVTGTAIGFCVALLLGASGNGLLSDFEKLSKRTVPAGTIAAFGGGTNSVPEGWLLCDGRPIKKEVYPDLFEAIKYAWGGGYSGQIKVGDFNLPDLRGRFLRGVDGGIGNDPDAAGRFRPNIDGNAGNQVGSTQPGSIISHEHSVNLNGSVNSNGSHNHTFSIGQGDGDPRNMAADGEPDGKRVKTISTSDAGGHSHSFTVQGRTVAVGGAETRPVNAYVNYIIKQ
jgi:microcystin-dependent protein